MHFLKTTALTLGAVVLLAAPAQAKDKIEGTCSPKGKVFQAFLPFGDTGLYTGVRNAGLENNSAGWELTGGAGVTNGNEPWFVSGATTDSHSLNLPDKASATTQEFCVDETFTHFRAFTRNPSGKAQLRVEVLFNDARGKFTSRKVDDVKGGSAWSPTGLLPIEVIKKAGMTTVPVAFRFTAKGGSFQLDDVYVDPWARS
jgi:hypothetical protein